MIIRQCRSLYFNDNNTRSKISNLLPTFINQYQLLLVSVYNNQLLLSSIVLIIVTAKKRRKSIESFSNSIIVDAREGPARELFQIHNSLVNVKVNQHYFPLCFQESIKIKRKKYWEGKWIGKRYW